MTSIGIHGYKGGGKGVLAAKFLWLYYRLKYPVCTNIWLNPYFFPDKIPLDLDYLYRLAITGTDLPVPRMALFIDELQYYADSRSAMDRGQLVMSYLEIQGRKRHIKYLYTSKKRKLVDLRLRDVDIVYSCEKYHKFIQDKKIALGHTKCFDDECLNPHWFEYVMIDLRNDRGKRFKITKPEPLYRLYRTDELTAPTSAFTDESIKKAINEMKTK